MKLVSYSYDNPIHYPVMTFATDDGYVEYIFNYDAQSVLVNHGTNLVPCIDNPDNDAHGEICPTEHRVTMIVPPVFTFYPFDYHREIRSRYGCSLDDGIDRFINDLIGDFDTFMMELML